MKYDTENLADVMQIAPFHRWLGLKIVQQNNDQLELEMPWRDELVSPQRGLVRTVPRVEGVCRAGSELPRRIGFRPAFSGSRGQ